MEYGWIQVTQLARLFVNKLPSWIRLSQDEEYRVRLYRQILESDQTKANILEKIKCFAQAKELPFEQAEAKLVAYFQGDSALSLPSVAGDFISFVKGS